ncbi:hypothetical protein WJM97_00085 [Okeanomitos corallinicola TIOX110]|uniref:Uncharacterized protein n=1 Tax=Okeanomitos corallinicola TIOX110 TaxID=3133117 RepID=A0ABZ2UTH1_9CYAN
MRLKRWESPRKQGRNDKGRGGSARQRQLKKQRQVLRNKLKEQQKPENNQNKDQQQNHKPREGIETFPIFFVLYPVTCDKSKYFIIFLKNYLTEPM